MRRFALVLVFATLAFALARAEAPHLEPYVEPVPGRPVTIEMAPVPFRGDAPGFWIGRHEVTRTEFEVFLADQRLEAGPRRRGSLSNSPDVSQPEGGSGDGEVRVTVEEAAAYARWLSRLTGHTYRLPTEAEWEQACRARLIPDAEPLDMLGGLPEWTVDGAGARGVAPAGVLKGGPWDQAFAALDCGSRRPSADSRGGFRLMSPYRSQGR